jgi:23S rRNA pseudouridine1911/1915/1917 synthase
MATRGDAGERLDLVLRRHLDGEMRVTRTRVQRWIRDGAVLVNGRPVRRPATRAAHGDMIVVSLPAPRPRMTMQPEAAPLEVIFEDEHLLAVNKPPGLLVHPTFRHPSGTLMNALLWRARTWPGAQRPSLVGRLDRLTSGIVLVAKTRAMHAAVQRTLARTVSEKSYLAVVYGRVPRPRGTIDVGLRRDADDRRRVVASARDGAPSLTEFERLARVAAPRAGLSLLRCRLVTGRMHQIRVHLAARGWPIVGDPQYGEPRWSHVADPALADVLREFPRQALHAWTLSFPHPVGGARVQMAAPLPSDLTALLRAASLHSPQLVL